MTRSLLQYYFPGGKKLVGKNNLNNHFKKKGDNVQRFTIKKFSVGAASVAVGTLLLLPHSVSAEEADATSAEETYELSEVENPDETEVVDELEATSIEVEEAINEEAVTQQEEVEAPQLEEVEVFEEAEVIEEEITETSETTETPETPVSSSEEATQNLLAPMQVEENGLGEPTEVNTLIHVRTPSNMNNYANILNDFENHPLILTNQVTGEQFRSTVQPSDGNTSNNFTLETTVHAYESGNQPSGRYTITLLQELIDLGYSLTRDHSVQANFGIVGSTNLTYNAPQDTSNTGELSRRDTDYSYFERTDIDITLTTPDSSSSYTLGSRNVDMPSGDYTIRISNAPENSRPELILRESSVSNAPARVIPLERDGSDYVGRVTLDFSNSTRPQILEIAPAPLATIDAPEVYDLATRKSPSVEGITPEGAEEIRVYLPGDSQDYRVANILSENPFTGVSAFRLALPEGYAFTAGQEVRVTAVDENGNESEATVQTVIDSDALVQLTVDPIYPEASTISGTVNPDAESVHVYLPNGAQISGTVQDDGTWSANLFGNASQLVLGEKVSVRVRMDENTHRYEDEFEVVADEREADISLENSSHILARLGFYGDRYYRNTLTLVDELGRPVEGLTEADFNIIGFGGIANFTADGNVYRLDTAEAGELRPDYSLSIEDGIVTITIVDDREAPVVETARAFIAYEFVDEDGNVVHRNSQYTNEEGVVGETYTFPATGIVLPEGYNLAPGQSFGDRLEVTYGNRDDYPTIRVQVVAQEAEVETARAFIAYEFVDEESNVVHCNSQYTNEEGVVGDTYTFPATGIVLPEGYTLVPGQSFGERLTVEYGNREDYPTITVYVQAIEDETPGEPGEPGEPEEPGDDLQDIIDRIEDLEDRVDDLEEENRELREELERLQEELDRLREELAAVEGRIDELEDRVDELEDRVDDLEDQVEDLEARPIPEAPEVDDEDDNDVEVGDDVDGDDDDRPAPEDPSKPSNPTDAEASKEDSVHLPKTGAASTPIGLAIASILSGLGLSAIGKKRKED